MKTKLNSSGFTLLELVIVAMVFGIAASLAVPRFGQVMQKLKFKTEGKDVLSTLRLARSSAVSQREQFGVYFDCQLNEYILFHDRANPASFSFDPSQDSVISTNGFSKNVHLAYTSFPGFAVVFRPNGSASNSGYVSLYSSSEERYVGTMAIDVLASTGRVKLTYTDHTGDY
jgi:prepilin-type N-terminal cleavage/methylation domain-containing protein